MNHIDEFTQNEYLDGELDGPTAETVAAHLASCAACRAELAKLELLFARLDGVADLSPEIDLANSVVATLAPRPRLQGWVVGLLGVQALAAVLLGIWLWPTLPPLLPPLAQWVEPALSAALWQGAWETAAERVASVFSRIQSVPAAPDIATGQWGLLLGLALLLWLAGNRILLPRRTNGHGGQHG